MIKFQTIRIKNKKDFKKIPRIFFGSMTNDHIGKTAIIFNIDKSDEVILSRELIKIISKLDDVEVEYLFLTSGLTTEGNELLNEKGIEYITLSYSHWTDESYKSIKQI